MLLTQQIVGEDQDAVLEVISAEENLCYGTVSVRDGKLVIEVNHPFEIQTVPAYVD